MICSWMEVGDGCWRFAALGPDRENPVTDDRLSYLI